MSKGVISYDNVSWDFLLDNLILLFRKDTFYNLCNKKSYYPQETINCRYYIKPNDGSCGKGIKIINSKPEYPIENYTICPEIISNPIIRNGQKFKCDFRVWIGICSDLKYFVCPTFIKRVSTIPFDIKNEIGSLTNTSLYAEQTNYKNKKMYIQINCIVNDILKNFSPLNIVSNKKHIMLTGWDFILNENNKLFVLEVNCSPGICILHKQVLMEFLTWINELNKKAQ